MDTKSNDISYRIEAQAITSGGGNGGKDFVDVIMKPQPRIAKVMFPKEMLINSCKCKTEDREKCQNGEHPYSECPFLNQLNYTGTTRVWLPVWVYNDIAAVLFAGGVLSGNLGLLISAAIVELLNYVFDIKLELAEIEIDESHLILDEMDITVSTDNSINFYLNYSLWVNSGKVKYLGGLYSYSLANRTLFGGLKINYKLGLWFDSFFFDESLRRYVFKGLKVDLSHFNVSLDWVDVPGATGEANSRARDEKVNKVRYNFLEERDENGLTGEQRFEKSFKYAVLTSLPTEIYYHDNMNYIQIQPIKIKSCDEFLPYYCGSVEIHCLQDCQARINSDYKLCMSNCRGGTFYGLADVFSDDYPTRVYTGIDIPHWQDWFNQGFLRGRRCDEHREIPNYGLFPIKYIPSQAHYSNPDEIPFVYGKESESWKWPSNDGISDRPAVLIKEENSGTYLGNVISIFLNYVDCLNY